MGGDIVREEMAAATMMDGGGGKISEWESFTRKRSRMLAWFWSLSVTGRPTDFNQPSVVMDDETYTGRKICPTQPKSIPLGHQM